MTYLIAQFFARALGSGPSADAEFAHNQRAIDDSRGLEAVDRILLP
jgi:hypothetical protein